MSFSRRLAQWSLIASVAIACADAAADKMLHVALPIAETSFDPAFATDDTSGVVIDSIMDAMLDYDYLARPVKLVPRALDAMPVIEDDGRTYICKLRKGILFAPDPAFKGKPRELSAVDYAYSLKRILDPAIKSPWLWMLEHKVVGADEARAKAGETGRFDYDAPIPGLEVIDRYTLKIRLTAPDPRFLYVLAVPSTAAMAREVVDAYGTDIGAHPVGTGPYVLGRYRRGDRIELLKSPTYRDVMYLPAGPVPAASQPIATALKGKRLPLVPKVDIRIAEEGQARWLAFLNNEIDVLFSLPIQFTDDALATGKLKPALAAMGVGHQAFVGPEVGYVVFDMEDAVVGGYSPEKVALRRAISMAYDVSDAIRVLHHQRAVPAQGPIPPDIAGYDTMLVTDAQTYDPGAARALLDRFGYKDRNGEGYRQAPDGKRLVIEYWSPPTSEARERDELWKHSMDAIGLRLAFKKSKMPEIVKMARQGQVQMFDGGWIADYPDAEDFMQLLYGPNVGRSNASRFNLPEFNHLFEQAQALPDSPERTRLFNRMAELVVAYAPWRITVNPITDTLEHRWVRNFVPHPMRFPGKLAYVDLDESLRAAAH
ncbi:MAG TPA: ABC transporter substrate-binding protein [Casimicrobiaceae bacterium]|nr:ABC transporter substrate-binding protein [Casimicrobiaceae bacterium]